MGWFGGWRMCGWMGGWVDGAETNLCVGCVGVVKFWLKVL